MKVSIFSTYDTSGGAALASHRLHRALLSNNVDSRMYVQRKFSDDRSVFGAKSEFQKIESLFRPYFDSLPLKVYGQKRPELFSIGMTPDRILSKINEFDPDIVHLIWVAGGFLNPTTVPKIKKPIVWTLHDMWPFTGGCHYDDECGRMTTNCGACPILGSQNQFDLSYRNWKKKNKNFESVPITVVATSKWLGDVARRSTIFRNKRIEIIPNNVVVDRYKPIQKSVAREAWNLPQNKTLILFSAHNATADKRKGHQFLAPAFKKLKDLGLADEIELVIIGASYPPQKTEDWGMKVHYMGRLSDEMSQVLLYSAADMTIAPSTQENLSNTVMESMSCGTPVVAFNVGGMPDMIDHKHSGYLATPFDPLDLAAGIQWIVSQKSSNSAGNEARSTVLTRYNERKIADQYKALYLDILSGSKN